MTLTTSWTTAMKRLAEHLGWTLESSGRAWTVTDPIVSEELGPVSGTSRWVLAHMVTVALCPSGYGLPRDEVRDILGLTLRVERNGEWIWPSAATATEQAALAPVITFRTED